MCSPVIFVGAGPGDPELLTLRGKRAIEQADVVIYAGSLVSREIVAFARSDAEVYDSSGLNLRQIHGLMRDNARNGKRVVRLHTGDPSLYGTLHEQTCLLDEDHIPWRVVPGVTAAMAAAAAAGVSFSIPECVQSLVLTRMGGRTPMPESLGQLAKTRVSMAVYLVGGLASQLQEELTRELPLNTPVICAYRIGWPDERVQHTTLANLSRCMSENSFNKQTVVLILPAVPDQARQSKLYDATFGHSFRQGE